MKKYRVVSILAVIVSSLTPFLVAQDDTTKTVLPDARLANLGYAPSWAGANKKEIQPEQNHISRDVQRAREHMFRASNLSLNPDGGSKVGHRAYILHLPVEALPVAKSDAIVIAKAENFQPYLAENKSSVFTVLQLGTEQYVAAARAVPRVGSISILYSGGAITTLGGERYAVSLASGSTPLELLHRYLLFLSYALPTDSFRIVRAWDVSTNKPLMLDETGSVAPNNRSLNITDSVTLDGKLSLALASQQSLSAR